MARARRRARKTRAVATSAIDKQQQAQITKIVKKLNSIQPETKWAEYNSTTSYTTYAGDIVTLNSAIAQGLGDFGNRTGDEITMKGLRLRVNTQWGYNDPVQYRIILFQYLNDPDGATSTASLINLLLHSTNISTANAVMTAYDHDNRSSFKVWYDKTFQQNCQTLTSTNVNPGQHRFHEINLRFKPGSKFSKVKYFAAGNTTTKNELFMIVLSSSSYNLYYNYNACLYYTDS